MSKKRWLFLSLAFLLLILAALGACETAGTPQPTATPGTSAPVQETPATPGTPGAYPSPGYVPAAYPYPTP